MAPSNVHEKCVKFARQRIALNSSIDRLVTFASFPFEVAVSGESLPQANPSPYNLAYQSRHFSLLFERC